MELFRINHHRFYPNEWTLRFKAFEALFEGKVVCWGMIIIVIQVIYGMKKGNFFFIIISLKLF